MPAHVLSNCWLRLCLATQNCPYQASAKNFDTFIDELDGISTDVKEVRAQGSNGALVLMARADADSLVDLSFQGDVVIAATDGVLDNMFDQEVQAFVSDKLHALMGDDPVAAQEAITLLAKGIAERANAIGLKQGDASIDTPFTQAAAEEGYEFRGGGKLDDVAIVCGVVREGARPGLRMVHNFDGAADQMWLQPTGGGHIAASRGTVAPTAPFQPPPQPQPLPQPQPGVPNPMWQQPPPPRQPIAPSQMQPRVPPQPQAPPQMQPQQNPYRRSGGALTSQDYFDRRINAFGS